MKLNKRALKCIRSMYLQNANRAFKKFSSCAITIKTTLKKKRFEIYIAKGNGTKRKNNKTRRIYSEENNRYCFCYRILIKRIRNWKNLF